MSRQVITASATEISNVNARTRAMVLRCGEALSAATGLPITNTEDVDVTNTGYIYTMTQSVNFIFSDASNRVSPQVRLTHPSGLFHLFITISSTSSLYPISIFVSRIAPEGDVGTLYLGACARVSAAAMAKTTFESLQLNGNTTIRTTFYANDALSLLLSTFSYSQPKPLAAQAPQGWFVGSSAEKEHAFPAFNQYSNQRVSPEIFDTAQVFISADGSQGATASFTFHQYSHSFTWSPANGVYVPLLATRLNGMYAHPQVGMLRVALDDIIIPDFIDLGGRHFQIFNKTGAQGWLTAVEY